MYSLGKPYISIITFMPGSLYHCLSLLFQVVLFPSSSVLMYEASISTLGATSNKKEEVLGDTYHKVEDPPPPPSGGCCTTTTFCHSPEDQLLFNFCLQEFSWPSYTTDQVLVIIQLTRTVIRLAISGQNHSCENTLLIRN